ncbi:hypothetical protein ES703_125234 [subsurface metagenome]
MYTSVDNSNSLDIDFYLYDSTWAEIENGTGIQTYYYGTALGPGLYYERVITPSGCVDTASYLLEEPDAISIADTIFSIYNDTFNVSCSYSQNGEIEITGVDGGHGNYTYVWKSGEITLPETSTELSNVPAVISY